MFPPYICLGDVCSSSRFYNTTHINISDSALLHSLYMCVGLTNKNPASSADFFHVTSQFAWMLILVALPPIPPSTSHPDRDRGKRGVGNLLFLLTLTATGKTNGSRLCNWWLAASACVIRWNRIDQIRLVLVEIFPVTPITVSHRSHVTQPSFLQAGCIFKGRSIASSPGGVTTADIIHNPRGGQKVGEGSPT